MSLIEVVFFYYVYELRGKEKTRFAFIKNYIACCFDIICYKNMFNKSIWYTYHNLKISSTEKSVPELFSYGSLYSCLGGYLLGYYLVLVTASNKTLPSM